MYPQARTLQLQRAGFPVAGPDFHLSATAGRRITSFYGGKTKPRVFPRKKALSPNASHSHNQPEIRREGRKAPLPPAPKRQTAGGNEHTGIPKTKHSPINAQIVRNKIFYQSICSTTALSNPGRTALDAFCR